MAISLKHSKISDKSDGQDDSLLQPSHWNAEHNFTVPAKKLVGNSTSSEALAEDISVGAGLELEDGELTAGGLADAQVVVSVADTEFPNARVLTGVAPVTVDLATAAQAKVGVADNGITLAKLDHGVQGDILYYADAGAPTRLSSGSAGMFLKTGTAAVVGPPAVAAINPAWAFSGAPHAVLRDKKASGTQGGAFDSGAWRDRVLNTEVYDTYEFVTLATATATNTMFTLVAGTYVIEWSAPAYNVNRHQTRLLNVTDNVAVEYGSSEFSQNTQTRSVGTINFTIAASKQLKIQHQCATDSGNSNNFGVASDFAGGTVIVPTETYTIVKIWRVA